MSFALMSMWTVYRRPSDEGSEVVARRWEMRPGIETPVLTADERIAPTPDCLHQLAPPGLAFVTRLPADDESIIEHWL